MKAVPAPTVPKRSFSIPYVSIDDVGFVFYTMLLSYKTSVTASMKAATAAMAFGYLARHSEMLACARVRRVALAALLDIETDVSISGGAMETYFLGSVTPRVRAAMKQSQEKEA